MKRKLSITIEEDMFARLDKFVRKGTFRNKSHCIEFALGKLMEDQNA